MTVLLEFKMEKTKYKENLGTNTKGISQDIIEIDNFTEKGILNKYHISSFIKRDGISVWLWNNKCC